jgi:hypothetical protein
MQISVFIPSHAENDWKRETLVKQSHSSRKRNSISANCFAFQAFNLPTDDGVDDVEKLQKSVWCENFSIVR